MILDSGLLFGAMLYMCQAPSKTQTDNGQTPGIEFGAF